MASASRKTDTDCRRILGFHCVRAILLDLTSPFQKQAGLSLIEALENLLCICGKMEGPPRIPLLSVYLLTSNPMQILPYSFTKNNFVHIHAAFTEIRTFIQESLSDFQSRQEKHCMQQGIVQAYNEFNRYVQCLPQAPHNFKKLEMTILTGHSGQYVQSQFEAIVSHLNLDVIKRVVSATVRSTLIVDMTTDDDSLNVPAKEDATGLMDIVFLDCDPFSLQNFFYNWLNESSNDSEHLHIILPAPTSADSEVVIKCDLIEQMLSPYQLPFYEAFDLHTETMTGKHVFPSPNKVVPMVVPVHHLKAVCCIPLSKLCDSSIFGLSLVVMPTACWTMDWEMTERNQCHFAYLCKELFSKDVALLTKLDQQVSDNSSKEWPANRSTSSQVTKPSGYFMLLPSEHKRMLLKSVISRELVLPFVSSGGENLVDEMTEMRIQSSLSFLETVENFNPLFYESGLWQALKHISLPKSAVDRALAGRKKVVLLQNKPSLWGKTFIPPGTKK